MSNDWWAERQQNEQLEQLQSEMSYARQETSRLQSQLSRIQGGLQDRVNRLSTAFDAFVELSDLRYEMAGFLDAAELRRYASRVLSAMASGTALPPVAEAVPQYWLGPATQALIALHSSEPNDQALSTALELDQRRTSTYLALALATLGLRHQVRSEWLDVAFGVPAADGTVTRTQRVLWATAARGGFGADGLELVVKRLQSVAPPADGWLAQLEKRGEAPRTTRAPFDAMKEQDTARVRLGRLRNAVETIAGNTAAREPDPALGYEETAAKKTAAKEEGADAAGARRRSGRGNADAKARAERDSAPALLRLLISEGSEPEREPLARAAVLRAQISGSGEAKADGLEDPVGTVEKLLGDDLAQTDDPHLPAAALRVIAPTVLPATEALAEVAGRPSPAQVTVAGEARTITIRPDGPDQLELGTAMASIKATAGGITPGKIAVPVVLAVAGALVAVGLGFVHGAWIVAGLVLVAIGAYRYWKLLVESKNEKIAAEDRATRLNERCTAAVAGLAAYTNATGSRQAGVAADLAAIREHLTS
ncbi:hypothetical protein [Kribbella sp. NPDC004875]|uniref:hypothetical protein n=1 Tax=Kribbella sp. NPDC004875 TaxID=3364107 RepID=UPI00369C8D32